MSKELWYIRGELRMTLRFYLYLFLLLVVTIIGFSKFKKLAKPFKYLAITVSCVFLSELLSRLAIYFYGFSTPVYHILCFLLYFGYSRVYLYYIPESLLSKIIKYSVFVIFVFSALNIIFLQNFFSVPTYMIVLVHILFIAFSLNYFIRLIINQDDNDLFKDNLFLFNSVFLVYCSTFLLTWPFYNVFLKSNVSIKILDTINYINNILYYFMVGVCLFLNGRKQKINEK